MIQPHNIQRLFDKLWPGMHASASHRDHCLKILPQLESCFKKWGTDWDNLLDCLAGLDGIGLTIASGLIWSVYPSTAVPFDKWTMSYALEERILTTPLISNGNYTRACRKITAHCEGLIWIKESGKEARYTIKRFVRHALQEADDYEWSQSPE